MSRVVVPMFVLVCLMAGCGEEPVGLAPGQYCHQLNEITGSVRDTCPATQERIRQERPEEYACMSRCVESSTDLATFDACGRACTAVP